MVELEGVPRPNSGSKLHGRWPQKSAEFLLHVLRSAESNAVPIGLDVDCLVIEHIQVSKLPGFGTDFAELMVGLTPTPALPATLSDPLKKEQVAQKEKIFQKKLKKQELMA